jgi:hypothetical protein
VMKVEIDGVFHATEGILKKEDAKKVEKALEPILDNERGIKRVVFVALSSVQQIDWEMLRGKLEPDAVHVLLVHPSRTTLALGGFYSGDGQVNIAQKYAEGAHDCIVSRAGVAITIAGNTSLMLYSWTAQDFVKSAVAWRYGKGLLQPKASDRVAAFAIPELNLIVAAYDIFPVSMPDAKFSLDATGLRNVLEIVKDAMPLFSASSFSLLRINAYGEEALAMICAKGVAIRAKKMREEIDSAERNAASNLANFLNERRNADALRRLLPSLDSNSGELYEMAANKLARVKSMSDVAGVSVDGGSLIVRTKPIKLSYNGAVFNIGEYDIRLAIESGAIRIRNVPLSAKGWLDHTHPHGYSGSGNNGGFSDACFGTSADGLVRSLAAFDIDVVVLTVIQILKSYNPDSPLMRLDAFLSKLNELKISKFTADEIKKATGYLPPEEDDEDDDDDEEDEEEDGQPTL